MITVNCMCERKFPCYLYFLSSLVAVFLSFQVNAQLCNGSLGDPAVNITFGSMAGASASVPPGSYGYVTTTCPGDGFYTVTRQTSNCFNNTWHSLLSDHTGDGAFMLVNASFTPGDFFYSTVTDLCPNTTYEFAAWVANVMRPVQSILPNITFSVETPGGTVLNSFNTGDISVTASPEWKQYGFFFTTPSTNAVIVLRMTNNAPGGYGNDVALDDITFRPCGSKITAEITGVTGDTINVCEGYNDSYTFSSDVSAGYTAPLFQWQMSTDKGASWSNIAGATTLNYVRSPVATPGNYWYRLTVIEAAVASISSCRIASDILVLNVHPKPIVNAGTDRIMLADDPIVLAGSVEGEQVTYTWFPGNYISDNSILNPVISPVSDINYMLAALSMHGCRDTDYVYVKVVTGIYIPTAFTPNDDGKNDRWEIPFLDPAFGGTVKVYNRWGQLVYQVTEKIVSWDGKVNGTAQASGTYIYVIEFKNSDKKLKGIFTLIR